MRPLQSRLQIHLNIFYAALPLNLYFFWLLVRKWSLQSLRAFLRIKAIPLLLNPLPPRPHQILLNWILCKVGLVFVSRKNGRGSDKCGGILGDRVRAAWRNTRGFKVVPIIFLLNLTQYLGDPLDLSDSFTICTTPTKLLSLNSQILPWLSLSRSILDYLSIPGAGQIHLFSLIISHRAAAGGWGSVPATGHALLANQ